MQSFCKITTNDDLVKKSKEILEQAIFDFISGGAGSEWGLNNNLSAFKRYQIIPRILQNTGAIDASLHLLGKKLTTPFIIAPCAFHKLVCEEGEISTAKAAAKIGAIFTLSTMSSCSLEDVATASEFDKWFQLYIFKNKEITIDLVRRAEEAGYKALVVTVDVPAMGMRVRDIKNQFSLPTGIEAVNIKKFGLSSLSEKADGSKVKEHTDQQFDSDLGWDSIDWLRTITKLPIILKGVINPLDAEEALKHNIAAIIVSNHGGRQIDNIISPIDALPEIVSATNKKIPIIVDGGIRTGEDAFIALALGADAIMIGRPVLWSLSVGGEEELVSLFNRLNSELTLTMQLAGCKNLSIIKERGLSLLGGQNISILRFLEFLRKFDTDGSPKEAESLISSMRFFIGGTQ